MGISTKMPKELLEFDMTKPPGASWGIRIGGGVDRGKVLVIEKIIFNSIAYETGLKDRDYVVEINNTKVFELNHDGCKDLIRKAGDNMQIKIERGDHIVPNMDEAFPKKKKEEERIVSSEKPYWMQALEAGKGARNAKGFITVPSRGGCELFMELELGDSVLHKSKLGSLLGYHETLEVGCIDHSLVNLHFRKSVVDLGGGEFDTEGHEGVSEGLGIDLALVFEAFEGGKDNVIIVGATG